ncbi:MAG: hypothetical protein ACK5OS_03940 [Chryseotalea sp.]
MLTKYQKLGLVAGQIFIGSVCFFIGIVVTALLGTVYELTTGNYINDLSTHILYSFYGGLIGMQIGIGIDGYKYLKENGLEIYFKRFFGQSVIGLMIGFILLYIDFQTLTIILPMIGSPTGADVVCWHVCSSSVP